MDIQLRKTHSCTARNFLLLTNTTMNQGSFPSLLAMPPLCLDTIPASSRLMKLNKAQLVQYFLESWVSPYLTQSKLLMDPSSTMNCLKTNLIMIYFGKKWVEKLQWLFISISNYSLLLRNREYKNSNPGIKKNSQKSELNLKASNLLSSNSVRPSEKNLQASLQTSKIRPFAIFSSRSKTPNNKKASIKLVMTK